MKKGRETEMAQGEMMQALRLNGIGDLRYESVPLPKRQSDEVLLWVRACGVCGSDIPRVFTKGTYHFPTIIGHEFAGEVIDADDLSLIGNGAAVFPLIPCGKCSACRKGNYAQCASYDYYGSRCDGAMSQYIAVKKENVILLPDGVSYMAAAMCEPAAVSLHAFRKAEVHSGDTVVIFGVGPIGLLFASWVREADAKHVVLVARSEERADFARKLGFIDVVDSSVTDVEEYVSKLTGGAGADVCVEGTGSSDALELCLKCTGNFGRVVTMGNPVGDITLSQDAYWKILRKELKLVGTWNSSFSEKHNDWEDVLEAMKDRVIDPEALITHVFGLKDYEKAFQIMHEKTEPYCKVMFTMDER